LLKDDENKKFVAKDAYFRLQHVNSKLWLSFQQEDMGKNTKKKEITAQFPALTPKPREIDTFKVVKTDFEEIWETNFLLSAFPILIDLIEFMGPLVIIFVYLSKSFRKIN